MKNNSKLYNFISTNIEKIILLIFVLQPLMDIISYAQSQIGFSNKYTLILRFGVLAFTAITGFVLSNKKKVYFIFAAVCAVILAGHVLACYKQQYLAPVDDISNYIRVVQMPLFAICFITFLKIGKKAYNAVELGLIINFIIITVSVILSVVTGTYSHTYQDNQIGVLGWFSTSNAQSAIMSFMAPLMVIFAFRTKKNWLLILATVASFAQLYFLGTRLGFMAMAATWGGLIIILILRKQFKWKPIIIIGICFAICCAGIKVSPMYRNQTAYNQVMNDKQSDANVMMSSQNSLNDWNNLSKIEKKEILSVIYEFYSTKYLCRRFGLDKVLEAYNYTYSIQELTATRHQKIIFCSMLMDEQNSLLTDLFGVELSRMTYAGNIYDVENDFHGVFFLYGYVGLIAMILFILYFVLLIIITLIKDFKKYFTLEAGAFGIAFCLALIYAYNTAGVLRRPNSSFYLSIILAVIYYLIKIRDYDGEILLADEVHN